MEGLIHFLTPGFSFPLGIVNCFCRFFFDLFINYGWLAVALAALAWLLAAKGKAPTIVTFEMIVVVGILAFM